MLSRILLVGIHVCIDGGLKHRNINERLNKLKNENLISLMSDIHSRFIFECDFERFCFNKYDF